MVVEDQVQIGELSLMPSIFLKGDHIKIEEVVSIDEKSSTRIIPLKY